MPEPTKHESLSDYVGKFMGSKEARGDFPKQSQRAAVAYSKFKQAKKKRRE